MARPRSSRQLAQPTLAMTSLSSAIVTRAVDLLCLWFESGGTESGYRLILPLHQRSVLSAGASKSDDRVATHASVPVTIGRRGTIDPATAKIRAMELTVPSIEAHLSISCGPPSTAPAKLLSGWRELCASLGGGPTAASLHHSGQPKVVNAAHTLRHSLGPPPSPDPTTGLVRLRG